jgi:putative ubiquitin-RnfH superfamily antitoxin RatB of RatAB toxin-antitoxin module
MISVEVVYCPQPGVIDLVALSLPDGATLQAALDASGVLLRHALPVESLNAGVWGRALAMTAVLRDRDRVELYRPLQCDPKEARRLRYRQRAVAKKPLG